MITHNPLKGRIDYEHDLAGFEPKEIRLTARDGVPIAGWEFHDQTAPVTLILIHGWCGQKELLDGQIVFARRQGWDVVAIDLRNHGASGGRVSSMGYHEANDVAAAVEHVRASRHLSQTIILWGISMGAVAATRVAADDPSIAGLIVESSYLSLRETVWRHSRIFFGRVLSILTPIVFVVARWRAKIPIDELDVKKSFARISKTPVLFVASEGDERTPPSHARRLAELCRSPHRRVYIAPKGKHAQIFRENSVGYCDEVRRFVDEVLTRTCSSAFQPASAANPS